MRTHVVLVPGFGGFDALGRLNYYYGVTDLFTKRGHGALHYFENLPTASVCTRSLLLERFLCNLVTRNIIEAGDEIALVGHSTGGLDIRELVARLDGEPARAHGLIDRIKRLVFLSTPHRGTNIADWVREQDIARKFLVNRFRQLVEDDVSLPEFIRDIGDRLFPGGPAQLFQAAQDVHNDYHPRTHDPLELADARDAKYQVRRWLDHTDGDFLAINDLAVGNASAQRAKLEKESAMWTRRGIAARSYATFGRAPMGNVKSEHSLRSVFSVLDAARTDALETDVTYRISYTACCDGPFVAGDLNKAPWLGGRGPYNETGTVELADSDNDGIVNTASMLLPGGNTWIVPGDHADIIGHFERKPNNGTGKRIYEAYDLLSSGSSFTKDTFIAVWTDVFAFALP